MSVGDTNLCARDNRIEVAELIAIGVSNGGEKTTDGIECCRRSLGGIGLSLTQLCVVIAAIIITIIIMDVHRKGRTQCCNDHFTKPSSALCKIIEEIYFLPAFLKARITICMSSSRAIHHLVFLTNNNLKFKALQI